MLLQVSNYLFTQPLHRRQDVTRSIFKQSKASLNSVFFLLDDLSKIKERSLPYYIPIAEERTNELMPFSEVLVLCEIQTTSSRIWTWIANSISYDDNNYTKCN